MVGRFTGIFVGCERRKGKRGEYAIVRFLDDERGKVFECIARGSNIDDLNCLQKLEQVEFIADVETGEYTKITFLGFC